MKKVFSVLIVFFFVGSFVYAQSVTRTIGTFYENEKIDITQYLMEEDVFANRSWWCKNSFYEITNKTNNEMEVRVNYTIHLYDGKTNKTRSKKITNQLIKLRPHGRYSIMAKIEALSYNELKGGSFLDLDSAHIIDFELINFRIIQKDYEVR